MPDLQHACATPCAALHSRPAPDTRPGEGDGPIRVLLIEDDAELSQRLAGRLDAAGFAVDCAHEGELGHYMGQTTAYDAVVLDLGLPRMNGLEVLRRWRAEGRTMPVLILTARGTWSERVEGLNAGADDYLGKPFEAEEVIARLRALVRRAAGNPAPVLTQAGITLDTSSGTVTLGGQPVVLTAQELKILTYLMLRAGRIVSQSDLLDHIYGQDEVRDANTIEVFIARLRRKLGRDAIRTQRGLGYRIG